MQVPVIAETISEKIQRLICWPDIQPKFLPFRSLPPENFWIDVPLTDFAAHETLELHESLLSFSLLLLYSCVSCVSWANFTHSVRFLASTDFRVKTFNIYKSD